MTDPRLDFLDRLQAATAERMRRVERVADEVGTISGEATSDDRLVTVRVNPNGALLDLVLDDDALDLDARDLSAVILATARAATERAGRAVKDVVSPLEEPLDIAPTAARGAGLTVDGSDPGQPPAQAFDAAIERADRVADRIEDRVRDLDAGPR